MPLRSGWLLDMRKDCPSPGARGLEGLKPVGHVGQDQGPTRLPIELLEPILESSAEPTERPNWSKKELLGEFFVAL